MQVHLKQITQPYCLQMLLLFLRIIPPIVFKSYESSLGTNSKNTYELVFLCMSLMF